MPPFIIVNISTSGEAGLLKPLLLKDFFSGDFIDFSVSRYLLNVIPTFTLDNPLFLSGQSSGDYYFVGVSDLLVEPYQGRTYVRDLGALGPEREVCIEDFVEYISDGYECYVGALVFY